MNKEQEIIIKHQVENNLEEVLKTYDEQRKILSAFFLEAKLTATKLDTKEDVLEILNELVDLLHNRACVQFELMGWTIENLPKDKRFEFIKVGDELQIKYGVN